MILRDKETRHLRKKKRIRKKVIGSSERPRVSVYKSNKHFYAQVINDFEGKTIYSISTRTKKNDKKAKSSFKDNIVKLGKVLGEEFKGKKLVLDRNGFLYHGNIKIFADAVREAGGLL